MQRFLDEFPIDARTRILDVGGAAETWSSTPGAAARIVLLNMPRASGEAFTTGFACVAADACSLPFADRAFDIVFSNSVIEHVGPPEAQARFAAEAARVGKAFWVQTPNRYFPIETHLLTPFVHWLPKRWSAPIVRRFTVWALLNRIDAEAKRWYIEHFLKDIRLCSAADLRRLFPQAEVRKERFLLMTKSLIAVRKEAGTRSSSTAG